VVVAAAEGLLGEESAAGQELLRGRRATSGGTRRRSSIDLEDKRRRCRRLAALPHGGEDTLQA
jgi:hypothetical protein